jgi:hexulose-6-phosphate isomerase
MQRRNFLQGTLTTFATVAACQTGLNSLNVSSARSEDKPASTIPVDMTGKIFKAYKGGPIGTDLASMIKTLNTARELGFDGIEAESFKKAEPLVLKEAIAETGVYVHGLVDGLHWTKRLSDPDPAVREEGRAALEQTIRECHLIGGSAVLLVPGKVTGPTETHEHVWERSSFEVRKVLPLAAYYGIPILMENVWNGFCETPEQFCDYIDSFNSPWIGMYFDIGNIRKFGKPEDWIRKLGHRIRKLDMKDWGQKNAFCRLGEGDVDFPAVCQALHDIGYNGWATREGKDKDLADTVQLMNQLLQIKPQPAK